MTVIAHDFKELAQELNKKDIPNIIIRDEEQTVKVKSIFDFVDEFHDSDMTKWDEWYNSAQLIDNTNGGTMVTARLNFPLMQAANNAYAALYGRNGTPQSPEMYSAAQNYEHRQTLLARAESKHTDDQTGEIDTGRMIEDQFWVDSSERCEESRLWYSFCKTRFENAKALWETLTGEVFEYKPYVARTSSGDPGDRKTQLAARAAARLKQKAA